MIAGGEGSVRVLTVAYNCTRVCSLESRISSLVACAQSIPKSHYAANASERVRERQRVSCWQIAWRLTHSATCCPSTLSPLPHPLLLLHFTFYVRQHQQVTKCIACQMVYVSGDGANTPPPLSTLLPLANSLQFLHL